MKVELGKKYRDIVTGFEGIAVSRHEYLNGCIRFSIQPQKIKEDGRPVEPEYVDNEQLASVDEGIRAQVVSKDTGGPGDAPRPRAAPRQPA